MKYLEMRTRHSEELGNFPHFFAFSEQQFEAGKKKLGVTDNAELVIGEDYGNIIMRKEDSSKFREMLKRQLAEMKTLLEDDEELTRALEYQLGNHEYGYTGDSSDAVARFVGLVDTTKERFNTCLTRAVRRYNKRCCIEGR